MNTERLKQNGTKLLFFAAFVVPVIKFVQPPPEWIDLPVPGDVERLGGFVVLVVAGLLLVTGSGLADRKFKVRWMAVFIATAALSTGAVLTYLHYGRSWTVEYLGERVLMGSSYTDAAYESAMRETYIDVMGGGVTGEERVNLIEHLLDMSQQAVRQSLEEKGITNTDFKERLDSKGGGDLLKEFGSKSEKVWTKESIDNRLTNLTIQYVLCLGLLTAAFVSLLRRAESMQDTKPSAEAGSSSEPEV